MDMEATTTDDAKHANSQVIHLTLILHSEKSEHQFCAYPQQKVGDLLQQQLSRLEQGKNAEQMRLMRECYQPVLERVRDNDRVALNNAMTLRDAGIVSGDSLQIAAIPRKEKLLFCRYSG